MFISANFHLPNFFANNILTINTFLCLQRNGENGLAGRNARQLVGVGFKLVQGYVCMVSLAVKDVRVQDRRSEIVTAERNAVIHPLLLHFV